MSENKIAIVGLGYVGLPLAVEFARKYKVIGYDINTKRVKDLCNAKDNTLEVSTKELKKVLVKHQKALDNDGLGFLPSSDMLDISKANIFIVTVPTPTDKNKRPVLTPLIKASETIGKVLKKGDYVIYESTVYPGVTEDECVPILEKVSGLNYNEDFFVGYSPERINPGDKERTLTKILKVTSGSTPQAATFIDELYKSIITAGTHLAPSIKVAEASKVIENSQRDINIAFVNELAKIFNKLDIDTHSVLNAAGTKWNFLPFKPGLVGGHCIGVDPYYLAQKAQEIGYYPEIILAGRRINDSMGSFVASEIVKRMVQKDIPVKGAKALLLGFTFKENCPDVRNTRVIDIYKDLVDFGLDVTVYDPWVDLKEVECEYGFRAYNDGSVLKVKYSTVILAVSHDEFLKLKIEDLKCEKSVIFDIKGFLPSGVVDVRL
jgi:UDP-N-acetyl-D-galactosamine dehydrogenase